MVARVTDSRTADEAYTDCEARIYALKHALAEAHASNAKLAAAHFVAVETIHARDRENAKLREHIATLKASWPTKNLNQGGENDAA